nr:MAG TPA: hypothetical protein [Caudoviricetes sp.]
MSLYPKAKATSLPTKYGVLFTITLLTYPNFSFLKIVKSFF